MYLIVISKIDTLMVRLSIMVNEYRMSTRMIWTLLAVLILLAALLPRPIQAQSDVQIERMQINIWPEYDRRSILIIYRFALAQDTSLPAELTISMPSAAQVPFNVAFEDVDGLLYTLDYTLQQNGEWIDITFTTPSPGVQVEFYDPDFERNGDQRGYEYTWPGNYLVRTMTVMVQQPVNATSMTIRPDIGRGRQGPGWLDHLHCHDWGSGSRAHLFLPDSI
jgi:hypothetical protein